MKWYQQVLDHARGGPDRLALVVVRNANLAAVVYRDLAREAPEFTAHAGFRRLRHPATLSTMQVRTADIAGLDGMVPTFVVVALHDEQLMMMLRAMTEKRGGSVMVVGT